MKITSLPLLARRDMLTLLGGAAAWPVGTRAQQAGKLPTIGFLGTDVANWTPWTAAFVGCLRELGWIEGRTIAIDYRWAQGRPERVVEIAAEFVRLKVDVIVTYGAAVTALKQATPPIPIVFAAAIDPIGGGLVASLAHPGGNVTGLSLQSTDASGKRLELLSEVVPRLRRLAIMFDGGYPSAVLGMGEAQAAARMLGLDVTPLEIRRAEDIAPAFEALKTQGDAQATALYVVNNALIVANRTPIITFATGARLPTVFDARDYVQAGGLLSYGASYPALFRRAAELVDKILHGTKPADIPVEQATKFELVVNLTTAKALDLTIPETFLLRADEVIE